MSPSMHDRCLCLATRGLHRIHRRDDRACDDFRDARDYVSINEVAREMLDLILKRPHRGCTAFRSRPTGP